MDIKAGVFSKLSDYFFLRVVFLGSEAVRR